MGCSFEQPGMWLVSGRRRVGSSGPECKSFVISKWLVWEAYKQVRANKGAAGVDEQSLAEFEVDLENNLYKIWNRLSSGTYFHPRCGRCRSRNRMAVGSGFLGCRRSATGSRRPWWR